MVPPLIVKNEEVLVNPKPGEDEEALPTVVTFITPLDMVKEQGAPDETNNLPVKFIVPPSIIKTEVVAPPIALPAEVPTLKTPVVILNKPLIVGEPARPAMVAFTLFSQIPPVAGIL